MPTARPGAGTCKRVRHLQQSLVRGCVGCVLHTSFPPFQEEWSALLSTRLLRGPAMGGLLLQALTGSQASWGNQSGSHSPEGREEAEARQVMGYCG